MSDLRNHCRHIPRKKAAVTDPVSARILLRRHDGQLAIINCPNLASRSGEIERDRTHTTIQIQHSFSARQAGSIVNPLIQLARGEGIALGKNPSGKYKFQIAHLLQNRVTSGKGAERISPNHVAPLVIDVLDNAANKRELTAERTSQQDALGKVTIPSHQRHTQLAPRETVTKI